MMTLNEGGAQFRGRPHSAEQSLGATPWSQNNGDNGTQHLRGSNDNARSGANMGKTKGD